MAASTTRQRRSADGAAQVERVLLDEAERVAERVVRVEGAFAPELGFDRVVDPARPGGAHPPERLLDVFERHDRETVLLARADIGAIDREGDDLMRAVVGEVEIGLVGDLSCLGAVILLRDVPASFATCASRIEVKLFSFLKADLCAG